MTGPVVVLGLNDDPGWCFSPQITTLTAVFILQWHLLARPGSSDLILDLIFPTSQTALGDFLAGMEYREVVHMFTEEECFQKEV